MQDLSNAAVSEGEPAHPIRLPVFDFSSGVKVETGNVFDLVTEAEQKPVALIFGSYT